MAVALLTGAACSDPTTGLDARSATILPNTAAATNLELASAGEVARAVAMALSDRGLRQRVANDMRRSRASHEFKLHLQRYLQGPGGQLLVKMVNATGRSREDLLASVSALREMEFYMPVREHRTKWRGEDVLVATQLDDRGSILAYRTTGEPIALSPDTPSDTPTFVLVPRESNFDRDETPAAMRSATAAASTGMSDITSRVRGPSLSISGPSMIVADDPCSDPNAFLLELPPECTGGGAAPPPVPPEGLYFTKMDLRNTGESWVRGDPELEIHMFGTTQGAYQVFTFTQTYPGWPDMPTGQVLPINLRPVQPLNPNQPYPPAALPSTNLLTYNPDVGTPTWFFCAGNKGPGFSQFDINSTGTHWRNVLIAHNRSTTIDELLTGQSSEIPVHRRLAALQPPFELRVVERDDGRECPTPPRQLRFDASVQISTNPLNVVKGLDWEDVQWLFGGGNETLKRGWITSWDMLELPYEWTLYGDQADVTIVSRGLSRTKQVPEADPYPFGVPVP